LTGKAPYKSSANLTFGGAARRQFLRPTALDELGLEPAIANYLEKWSERFTYKARAMEKLGLETRAELVRYAIVKGWLGGP
jgi:hypothetical protein